MFNLHRFVAKQIEHQEQQKQMDQYQQFLNKRQAYKTKALATVKDRARQFINNQLNTSNPIVLPDQYNQRMNDSSNGLTKSVYLSSSFRSESRKQDRSNMALSLQQSGIMRRNYKPVDISNWQNTSDAMSGSSPSFRITRQDKQLLKQPVSVQKQPNVFSKGPAVFKRNVKVLYDSYANSKQKLRGVVKSNLSKYDHFAGKHEHSLTWASPQPLKKTANPQQTLPDHTKYGQERAKIRRKQKTYFKLIKTVQMFGDPLERQACSQCLLSCQFDRRKASSRQLSFSLRSGKGSVADSKNQTFL